MYLLLYSSFSVTSCCDWTFYQLHFPLFFLDCAICLPLLFRPSSLTFLSCVHPSVYESFTFFPLLFSFFPFPKLSFATCLVFYFPAFLSIHFTFFSLFTSPPFTFKYRFRSRLQLFHHLLFITSFVLPLTLATKNRNFYALVGDAWTVGVSGSDSIQKAEAYQTTGVWCVCPNHAIEVFFIFFRRKFAKKRSFRWGRILFSSTLGFGMLRRPHKNPPT